MMNKKDIEELRKIFSEEIKKAAIVQVTDLCNVVKCKNDSKLLVEVSLPEGFSQEEMSRTICYVRELFHENDIDNFIVAPAGMIKITEIDVSQQISYIE